MVKFWSSEHVFDHSWNHVTSANWRKYPNPFNPAVVSVDVADRNVTPSGTLETTRVMSTEFRLPRWVRNMVGETKVFAVERSTVDPAQKRLEMRSKNITLCNLITIEEKITYEQHPEDSTKTLMKQSAEITVPSMSFVEKMVADSIASNSAKGKQAMEWAIESLKSEIDDIHLA